MCYEIFVACACQQGSLHFETFVIILDKTTLSLIASRLAEVLFPVNVKWGIPRDCHEKLPPFQNVVKHPASVGGHLTEKMKVTAATIPDY